MTANIGQFGCVVLCACLSGITFAASEDFFEMAPDQLARVKITAASAFTETELDSSATVSVVTRDDWQRRAARTLPDAVLHLPGVMLLQPPDGGLLIQVRSYDSTSLRGRATLVDGVPINTFAFGSEVFSNAEMQLPVMDSLELVRGPSSILYGSDAFHSALVLTTYNDKSDKLELEGHVSSHDYQRIAARGTKTFDNNQSLQMAVGVAHQGDQDDEYTYPIGGDRLSASRDRNHESGTGMVRWSGNANAVGYHLELFTDHTNADEYPGFGTLVINDVRDYDLADRYSHLWMVKGGLKGALGAGWDWHWDNYYWRNDYGQNSYLLLPQVGYSVEDQEFVEHRYASRLNIKRADIRAFNATTQLAVAMSAERQGIDNHDVVTNVPAAGIPIPTPDYSDLQRSIKSLSFEGKTQWQEGRYQLIYGGRIDDYSTFGSEISPRVGAIWMPASSSSVRLLYGTAFRAPNANELRGTNFAFGDADLDPETIDNYELTFAQVFKGGIVQLTGFKTHWYDRILLVRTAGLGRYTNAGESKSYGAELSAKFNLEYWRFEVSGSRIENHTIDGPVRIEPEMFPEWMASVGIGYRWPAQRLELFWTNRLHQNVRTGDDAQRGNVSDAGFFYRSDISLMQQWNSQWTTQIALRNIFDRDNVWPSVVNSNDGIADIPRQISFEINYRGF